MFLARRGVVSPFILGGKVTVAEEDKELLNWSGRHWGCAGCGKRPLEQH